MYNILICDDERDIVSALKIYLSGEDYRLFEAYDGREALEIAEKNDIAIEYGGKVIGSLGFHGYSEAELPQLASLKAVEIGFALSKNFWGMGLMPEALAAVIGHLFDSLGYEALVCGYFEGNVRSQRVQEKCGFSRIKRVSCATKLGEIKEEWLSVIYRK